MSEDDRLCGRSGSRVTQRAGEPCAECGDLTGHGHHALPAGVCAVCEQPAGRHPVWCQADRDRWRQRAERAEAALRGLVSAVEALGRSAAALAGPGTDPPRGPHDPHGYHATLARVRAALAAAESDGDSD